jgi:release factor glutamine methyltransferase
VEVREHEPALALFAGADGLVIYRRLIPEARGHLAGGGWLLLEIGHGQQAAVEGLLEAAGYGGIHFLADYQGIERVACGQSNS